MRHRKKGRKLSRTASHRGALLSALATALFKHKKIRTTLAKAKEARTFVEPMITRACASYQKELGGAPKDVHARREVARFVKDREAVSSLFGEIAEKVGTRHGGYTRVVKLGQRLGDGAQMAVLELVDYNLAQEAPKKKGRGAKGRAATTPVKRAKKAPAAKEKAPKEEAVAVVEEAPKKTRRGARSKKVKAEEPATDAVEPASSDESDAASASAENEGKSS